MTHRLLIFTGLVAHIPVGRVFHHALLGAFYIFRRRYSSFLQENKISFMEDTYLCNALWAMMGILHWIYFPSNQSTSSKCHEWKAIWRWRYFRAFIHEPLAILLTCSFNLLNFIWKFILGTYRNRSFVNNWRGSPVSIFSSQFRIGFFFLGIVGVDTSQTAQSWNRQLLSFTGFSPSWYIFTLGTWQPRTTTST